MVMMQKCCALAEVWSEFPKGPGALRVGDLRPETTLGPHNEDDLHKGPTKGPRLLLMPCPLSGQGTWTNKLLQSVLRVNMVTCCHRWGNRGRTSQQRDLLGELVWARKGLV